MTSTSPFSLELQQRLFSYWQLSQYPQASSYLFTGNTIPFIHSCSTPTGRYMCFSLITATTSFGGLLNHCICYYSMLTAMKHVLYIFFARKIGRIPMQHLTPTLLSNGLHTFVHGEGYSFLPVFSVAAILGHYLLSVHHRHNMGLYSQWCGWE